MSKIFSTPFVVRKDFVCRCSLVLITSGDVDVLRGEKPEARVQMSRCWSEKMSLLCLCVNACRLCVRRCQESVGVADSDGESSNRDLTSTAGR